MANLLSQNEVDVLMKAISSGEVAAGPAKEYPQERCATASHARKSPKQNAKVYDFKHPVLFLKDQLSTLQMIHESFLRTLSTSLSSALRTTVKMSCTGVDQISYGEFVMSLPDPCTTVNVRIKPIDRRMLMAIHPIIGMGLVDKITGGPGIAEAAGRPFTEIEQSILEDIVALALRDLEVAWTRIISVAFSAETIEHSAQFIQVATQEDTVVAITLEVTFGAVQGIISLCYPFRALNPIIEKLNAKSWIAEEQRAMAAKSRSNMNACVAQVPVDLSARLGSTSITMQELLQVKPGDLLLLDRSISDNIDLEVAGNVRFRGHLGTCRGKTSVLIESRAND